VAVRPPLVVIAGATATGKTGLAVRIAQALAGEGLPTEIVSADSRQVYRGLDIGTAKASVAERGGIPHHGLDLVDPDEPFSVSDFARHADTVLGRLAVEGRSAILAGGTGFYLRAVARGLDIGALAHDPSVRAGLDAELRDGGLGPLVVRLTGTAPTLAARIDLHNPRRVVRALEIALARGDLPLPEPRGYPAPVLWLGLTVAAVAHRERILRRARAQFDAGLIDEAVGLRERYDPALPAFSAIGYREAWAVADGASSLEGAIELDAHRNIAFAKRQATWFRAEPDIHWLDATETEATLAALDLVRSFLGRRYATGP
jgi:tRNA dimethylallyltransferase